jgi:hypothetical protein
VRIGRFGARKVEPRDVIEKAAEKMAEVEEERDEGDHGGNVLREKEWWLLVGG